MVTGQEQRPGINIALCKTSTEVIKQVDAFTRTLLDRHQDLVAGNIIDQIVGREARTALQYFGEVVLSREVSYFTNKEPGMTILVTPKGMERLTDKLHSLPYLRPTTMRPITDSLHLVHFSKGGYVMSGGRAQFYQEVSEKWFQGSGATGPFTLAYDQVVRAEGMRGEFWQNWDYNWDGTPKGAQTIDQLHADATAWLQGKTLS